MLTADPPKPRRIELILRQIDSLPTLPAVATRLLSLTASDDSHAREVIELVSADPTLTAKVLSLCRAADKGVREQVLTIERAVVLLGFNAIRNAVLSVKVFELFDALPERADETDGGTDPAAFDRVGFWQHSLAVAVLAERIAARHRHRDLPRDHAFVCGLLHDLGKLALDHVLPKSFARAVELANFNQGNLSEFERRIIGIDHHTAGKRLAEQWQLPHQVQDCIWLHGSTYETLPRLDHRRMIGLISLADLLARQQHVGYSGNFTFAVDPQALIEKLGLSGEAVAEAVGGLHDQLELHIRALGLRETPSRELFMRSIQRANETLGRLNQALERRGRQAATQARVLEAIGAFHAGATPGRSVQDVMDTVAASARNLLGPGFYGMLYPGEADEGERPAWLFSQYDREARPVQSQWIDAPPNTPDLAQLDAAQPIGMDLMGVLPWLADYLVDSEDLRRVRLMPLSCGWGTAAVLLHERDVGAIGLGWPQLSALTASWGAAIAAAAQHDGARRLGEQLAQANSALAEAHDRLLRQEAMARLGEMAAGAAHEMNNPLAVISGRSQLLLMSLPEGSKDHTAAQTIFREAHRLSDLITCLHMFAEPPRAEREPTDLSRLLDQTIKRVSAAHLKARDSVTISMQVKQPLSTVDVDGKMIGRAVSELLINAIQARPKTQVQVSARLLRDERTLLIQVTDDGDGMDGHTLAHAMDPFFSAKPAGRRVGMGLPRAQQLAAAHGGTLELRSQAGQGTTATLTIPLDSAH